MTGLFGTSGVRGLVGEEINSELAINLSKSIARTLKPGDEVLIGRDTRTSGEMIEDALISGFMSSGINVGKIGILPTPVVGFSVKESRSIAGIMVTASHNPSEYNGIKLFDSEGMAYTPDKEAKIESIYSKKDFRSTPWGEIGDLKSFPVLKDYLEEMAGYFGFENDYKVIVDCACGPSSKTTPALLRMLGCEVKTINSHMDGFFPGRSPEPSEENLQDLAKLVKKSDADLGLAHDGDGDRIAAVDGYGKYISADKLLALISRYSVDRFGGDVVTTVDASKVIDEMVFGAGGQVLRTKVGDVNVAEVMSSKGIKCGGEPSGTWIIGDIHMCPDGTVAAARILEMIDEYQSPISDLVDSIPEYPIVRDKVECTGMDKASKMESVKDKITSEFENIKNLLTEDGVRVEEEGGNWLLIRPSGTEPYIRLTSEANDIEKAREMIEKGKKIVRGK